MFDYKTIDKPVEDIVLKEKGSKFIGFAYPVSDDQVLRQHLQAVKHLHPKATHHCYAFRIGTDGANYRANDDGEPSGSAGLPIYNQLLAHDLTNVLVIVVRYYGGTKLGVSGLVKAYKETAKAALEAAEFTIREVSAVINLEFPFDLQNLVFTFLNKNDARILEFNTDVKCRISAEIKLSLKESIPKQLSGMHGVTYRFSC